VSRVPSPSSGVTVAGESCTDSWEDITPPSSLLRTHAPIPLTLPSFSYYFVRGVFAGCYQPLLSAGPSRRYLCESFLGCLVPYHGGSPQSAYTCFFLHVIGLPQQGCGSASPASTREHDFTAERFSRLQTFLYVQTSEFAHLPDRSYRCAYCRRAAEAFTSKQHMLRYLRMHRICLPPEYRQLAARGLSPRQIRSLVGCSPCQRFDGCLAAGHA
jgi:hypothetical protein